MSNKIIISDPEELLKRSLQHKNEYVTEVDTISLIVHPQVLSPKYSYSSKFIAKHWDIQKNMSILDMGTGCGILSVLAAKQGAKKVVAVDINPFACATTKKNFKLHNINGQVFQSDVFAEIPKQTFDRELCITP